MLSCYDSLYSLFDGSLCVKRVRAHMQIDIVRVTALYGYISVFLQINSSFGFVVARAVDAVYGIRSNWEIWLFRVDINFNQRWACVHFDWIRIFVWFFFSHKTRNRVVRVMPTLRPHEMWLCKAEMRPFDDRMHARAHICDRTEMVSNSDDNGRRLCRCTGILQKRMFHSARTTSLAFGL